MMLFFNKKIGKFCLMLGILVSAYYSENLSGMSRGEYRGGAREQREREAEQRRIAEQRKREAEAARLSEEARRQREERLRREQEERQRREQTARERQEQERLRREQELDPWQALGLPRDANPYQILGVVEHADQQAVDRAFRGLSLRWHPDKNPQQRELATKVFQIIGAAHDLIYRTRGWKEEQILHD